MTMSTGDVDSAVSVVVPDPLPVPSLCESQSIVTTAAVTTEAAAATTTTTATAAATTTVVPTPGAAVSAIAAAAAAVTAASQTQTLSKPWNALAGLGPVTAQLNPVLARLVVLRQQLLHNPFDVDTWAVYLRDAEHLGDKDVVRQAYDEFLDRFPTSARHWIQLAEFERRQEAHDRMEMVFSRCLQSVPSVALHKFYINYIQQVHSPRDLPPEQAQEANETVVKVFEYVISSVGTDIKSGSIWLDYIHFVANAQAVSNYEEQKKMDQLRKIFHRAVHTPLLDVEQIWKEYDAFENNLSKLTAKKFIAEKAAGYMTARAAIRDMKMLTEPMSTVERTWLARPPMWAAHEVQLLSSWKRYIAWEQSNPLHIESPALLHTRIAYAFKTALLQLRYFPELWYDASKCMIDLGMESEAISYLQAGIAINPTSLLLSFTLAEIQESQKADFKDIQAILDALLAKLEESHTEIHKKYDAEREAILTQLREADKIEGDDATEDTWDGERRERERELEKERDREVNDRVESRRERKVAQIKTCVGLTWVIYIRLARRSQNIKAARVVFSRARKSPLITYHVYVASALMELHLNKDSVVAGKIFELGMKTFCSADNPDACGYILHYIDFLIGLNDDNNTRALFERALALLPPSHANVVLAKYVDYEMQFGDIGMLRKAEKRYEDTYPEASTNSLESVIRVADRWRYFDINYIGEHELGIAALRTVARIAPPVATTKPTAFSGSNTPVNVKGRPMIMLGSVESSRFPRPDLTKWTMYRPEVGNAKVFPTAGGVSTPPSSGQPASIAPDADAPPLQPDFPISEYLAAFMASLPQSNHYDGPIVNVDELLQTVFKLPLPIPPALPNMVPIPQGLPIFSNRLRGVGNMKRSGRWQDDDAGK
ncbi:hypothetical protein BASA60_001591 [Batrachochytrium salamandrivorans]|nr:hypothetical protein BASA60_001591 [Batrachochytrium salamandrivorans]